MARAKDPHDPRRVTEQHKLLGQKLRAARLQAGLSQSELGHELGVTFQQVQKYEKGINRIDASRIMVVAKILGVGPEYFLGTLNAKPRSAATAAFDAVMATREGVQVIEAMAKMDDHQRALMVMIARRLPDPSVTG